ncbi:MAG: hypothetical protein EXR98_02285 [Gemmataceae bacterium]|nr:hypothetical protein [Gemmataceae bacterium]
MNALEIAIGILFAIILIAVAVSFGWRQRLTLKKLHADRMVPKDQRLYLLKQCQRRLFGSGLLVLLAGMLIGCLFLDFDPQRLTPEGVAQVDRETAKQATQFLGFYFMSMLLLVMVMLALAVFDFWATARHGVQQQKQLFQEHQEMLEAELTELRHRRAEMN